MQSKFFSIRFISSLLLVILLAGCASGVQKGTSQGIRSFTFQNNFSNKPKTSQKDDDIVFHNFGNQQGTSQKIGDITFHRFGNQQGTSQKIGNTTYHNGSSFGGNRSGTKFGGNRPGISLGGNRSGTKFGN